MALVATYPKLSGDWLRHELDSRLNRKQVVILSGTGNLATGAVLGKIAVAGATSAAKAGGNTGGGTLTLDASPVLAGAKPGVYSVRCVNLVANAGLFAVHDPDGLFLGNYQAGAAAFAKQIKFTMADVGTDFAVGDGFDITVAAGSGKFAFYDPTAVNGCATPAGILLDSRDASSADAPAVVVTGHAEIVAANLTWGAAVDDAGKKAAGVALLAKLGFQARALA